MNRPAANENTAVPLIEDFQIPESILGWKALPFKIALKDVALQDITVDYADEAGEMDFKYVINSLSLNRVTPGMTTEITLDSFLTGSLPEFRLRAGLLFSAPDGFPHGRLSMPSR